MRQGFGVADPRCDISRFDLLAWDLEDTARIYRVQAKTVTSDGQKIIVECRSRPYGELIRTHHYTAKDIDVIAVYDLTTETTCYISAALLGNGVHRMTLRVKTPEKITKGKHRYARDYTQFADSVAGDATGK